MEVVKTIVVCATELDYFIETVKRPSFIPSKGKGIIVFLYPETATPFAGNVVYQLAIDGQFGKWKLGRDWKVILISKKETINMTPLHIRRYLERKDVVVSMA